MEFPLWAVFGLTSAVFSAGVMLIQERVRLNGYAMAFWNKIACIIFSLPFVLYFGAPDNPYFYMLLSLQALLWVVSDVIFFNTINKVGAGSVSRILPASVIIVFFLWFIIDPSLIFEYAAEPVRSGLVLLVLCLSVFFSIRLRRCAVSWQAVRMLWFVLFASVIGPIMAKLVMQQGQIGNAPFAYVFFEASLMVLLWLLYYGIRQPIPAAEMFGRAAMKGGFMVGSVSCFMVASNVTAYSMVDNPGLVPAVKFMDTILILYYYRMIGRKDGSDVIAGLGIVVCAAFLILLKSW